MRQEPRIMINMKILSIHIIIPNTLSKKELGLSRAHDTLLRYSLIALVMT